MDNSAGQSVASSASMPVASSVEVLHPSQQQHSEATSSGSVTQPEGGSVSSVVMSHASPSVPSSFTRGRHVPPLCRQQQHLVLVSKIYENKHSTKADNLLTLPLSTLIILYYIFLPSLNI